MENIELYVLSESSFDISPVVRLWVLRLMVPLGGFHKGAHKAAYLSEDAEELMEACGLVSKALVSSNPKTVRAELRRLYQATEKELGNAALPINLISNVERLARLVGLSAMDCRILEFAVMVFGNASFLSVVNSLGSLTTLQTFHLVSVLLGLPLNDVRTSLAGQSILNKSGLVTVERAGASTFSEKLKLLSSDFADNMLSAEAEPAQLIRGSVIPAGLPHLAMADYDHAAAILSIALPYLRHALSTGRHGVNIFLYGEPGTGKSQLAKVIAQELGCELFEVASQDGEGDPVHGEIRLRAYRAAQSFFANRQALILFDEVEDVFEDSDMSRRYKSTVQSRKAWMNRMLEDNTLPTLWLSNSVSGMDPAFIRRFDIVIELPVPPKTKRVQIIREACADMVDASTLERMAESNTLSPAVVSRAASVVRAVKETMGPSGVAQALEFLINNTLEAQGHKALRQCNSDSFSDIYDPAFIQADCDLSRVAMGLQARPSARLCLYGPPGTGKTAYGRWLAQALTVPLLVKRASDLMSMWVGGNEKNIADAFKEAKEDGAVLLIDEVDSFLQDRRGAQRGWEVSLVNEMLTQMEAFDGVFIASTNLMTGLDQAALRRFDLKVKFDFLTSVQAWELLLRHCDCLAIEPPSLELKSRLKLASTLTPGDFAVVARQHTFRPLGGAADFVAGLEAEVLLKEASARPIGFLQ